MATDGDIGRIDFTAMPPDEAREWLEERIRQVHPGAPPASAPSSQAIADMETFVLALRANGVRRYKGAVPGTTVPLEIEFAEKRGVTLEDD